MSSSRVRDYYDRNTRWFLRWGLTGRARDPGTIHRELWGPGVHAVSEALDHVHHLIAERHRGERLLDLGCGVGGSLCRLLELHPHAHGVGVTVSPVQARLAQQRAARRALTSRATFLAADFHALPALPPVDTAFAVEAWVHAADPRALLAGVTRVLRPGGRLLLVDDFRGPSLPPAADAVLERFRAGWRAPNLLTVEQTVALAEAAGLTLVEDLDLGPWLRLFRPRDRVVAVLVALLGRLPLRHPYWGSLTGGHALQHGLSRGWITHRLLVFSLA